MRRDPESVLRLAWSVRCPFVSSRTDTRVVNNCASGALSVQVRVSTQNAGKHPLVQLVPFIIIIACSTSKALEKAAKLRVLFPGLSPSSSSGKSLSTKSWFRETGGGKGRDVNGRRRSNPEEIVKVERVRTERAKRELSSRNNLYFGTKWEESKGPSVRGNEG